MNWIILSLLPLLLLPCVRFCPRSARVTALLCGGATLPALAVALGWNVEVDLYFSDGLLGVSLGLDAPRRMLLLLAGTLWCAGGVAAAGYFREDPRLPGFRGFFLAAMSGNFGLIIAQDAASFYSFFALMTFASYGLVIHTRSKAALRAGRIYLILAIFGELLLIAAIYAGVQLAGSIQLAAISQALWTERGGGWIYGLALAGFGVKVGVIPLYLWLPLAHPVAPAPASAILSGSMLKAGLLGWLHFSPLTHGGAGEWAGVLVILGLAAAFGAVAVGLCQTDPKTNLAYSSISQMGLLTAFFGFGHASGAPIAWILPAIAIFAWHHGVTKGALFLGAGLVPQTRGRTRWILLACLAFAALVLAGAPFTGGAAAKGALKEAGTYLPEAWTGVVGTLLSLSSAGTLLLLGRFWLLCRATPTGSRVRSDLGWQFAALGALLVLALGGSFLLFRRFLPEMALKSGLTGAFSAAWPVGLGLLLLCLGMIYFKRNADRRAPNLPPGDLIVFGEWAARAFGNWWRSRGAGIFTRKKFDPENFVYRLIATGSGRLADEGEAELGRWNRVGVAFFVLLFIFIWGLQ